MRKATATKEPEIIEAEVVQTRSLAVAEPPAPPQAPPSLFGATDPVEVVQQAVRVADALKAVVVAKKLVANIGGKEYPQVEAWLTLAAMLRLTTICEWSRPVIDGWEARVYIRDASGATVGAAEAQCLSSERTKKNWEAYALRSMAQTRATAKALRSVLGFVMVLAGYEATPIEEMPTPVAMETAPPIAATNASGEEMATKPQLAKMHAIFRDLGYDEETRRDTAEAICGKRSSKDLTKADAQKIIDRLTNLTKATS